MIERRLNSKIHTHTRKGVGGIQEKTRRSIRLQPEGVRSVFQHYIDTPDMLGRDSVGTDRHMMAFLYNMPVARRIGRTWVCYSQGSF